MSQSENLILLRARAVDDYVAAFAAELRQASGYDVAYIVDERQQEFPSARSDVISLNARSYAELGLYCPPDVAWRCGDYGIYMAWRSQRKYRFYWLFEDDVRISGDVGEFFRLCAHSEADFLSNIPRRVDSSWYWWAYALSRDAQPYGCLFGTVRLSDRAVSLCYDQRHKQGNAIGRRVLWPNDEALVATTLMNSTVSCAAFNEVAPGVYERESYSTWGEPVAYVPSQGPPRLIHPVLHPQQKRGSQKTSADDETDLLVRLGRAAAQRLNQLSRW